MKRRLSELDLSRRGQNVDEEATVRLICREIEGAGRLAGYHSIWHALRIRHGVHVPRNLVARIVKEIDPEGVAFRKSRRLTRRRYMSLGPNFCWHIDGKLTACTPPGMCTSWISNGEEGVFVLKFPEGW